MIQGIDHLVILVDELERAIQDYTSLGFTVVPGGKHPRG
ncbi:MAG: VOC family protein, partial [Chloroflexota bacterium]